MCRTLRRIRTPFTHRTDREINLCVRQTRREGQRDPNNGLRMPLYCASTHFRFFSRWFLISARINVPTVGCHFLDVLIRIQRWKRILQSAPQSPHRKSKRQVNHFTRVISIFSLRFHAISATQTRASISHWFFFGTVIFSVWVCVCACFFNDIVHFTANKKTEFNAFREMGERAKMYYAVKILCILVLHSRWCFFSFSLLLRLSAYVMASKKKYCLPSEKWKKKSISETHHLCRWCCWLLLLL